MYGRARPSVIVLPQRHVGRRTSTSLRMQYVRIERVFFFFFVKRGEHRALDIKRREFKHTGMTAPRC